MEQVVSTVPLSGAALVVMQAEQPIYQSYFGSYTPSTRVPIASASKWLSTSTIAALIDDGLMNWDDPVSRFLPNAPLDKRTITLRQLLSHTSGLPGGDVGCLANQGISLDACVAQILAVPLLYAPGSCFAYGGNSFQVAGRMAEIAASKRWDAIFVEQIAAPVGMSLTDYAFNSAQPGYLQVANPRIAGGARSVALDLAKFAQMHAQNGMFNGLQVLSMQSVAEMAREQTRGANYANSPDPLSYGYGFGEWRNRVNSAGHALEVSSAGAFGTWPWVDYSANVAAVFFTRNALGNVEPFIRQITPAVRETVLGKDALFESTFSPVPVAMQQGCAAR